MSRLVNLEINDILSDCAVTRVVGSAPKTLTRQSVNLLCCDIPRANISHGVSLVALKLVL